MKRGNLWGLFCCATLLTMALTSGCGSSSNTSIPSTTTIYYGHTLLFRGYSTLTAGYNAFGQLGNGNRDNQASLVKVAGLGRTAGAAVGADHTVAYAFGNVSTVFAWGSNYHGQIGNAKTTSGTEAYSSTPVKVHGFNGGTITAVAAGSYHSLALVDLQGDTGNVFTWGYNVSGQLGNNSFADSSVPVRVVRAGSYAPLNNVQQIVSGGAFSAALRNDGTVYTWGSNADDALGRIPTSTVSSDPTADVVPILNDQGQPVRIVKLAAGGSTCFALADDNKTVYAWGYNGYGQLGLNPFDHLENSVKVTGVTSRPTAAVVPGLSAFTANATITDISAGLGHVLVLLSDGSIVSWGYNGFAQLGRNITPNSPDAQGIGTLRFPTPGYVLFDGTSVEGSGNRSTDVTKIIAVGNHSLAFRSGTGKWYGFGDNGYGQLGNPIVTNGIGYKQIPVLVGGF